MSDPPQEDDPGAGSSTGVKSTIKRVKRFFVSSFIKKEGVYSCELCPDQQPFENFKSLQRHNAKTHPDVDKASAEDLEVRDEIKCLMKSSKNPSKLCEKMVRRIDICRHLKFHGEERPAKKFFKGFFTVDKRTYTVAWGARNETFDEEEEIDVGDLSEDTEDQVPDTENDGAAANEGPEAELHHQAPEHFKNNNEQLVVVNRVETEIEEHGESLISDTMIQNDVESVGQSGLPDIVTFPNEEDIHMTIDPHLVSQTTKEVHAPVEVLVISDKVPSSGVGAFNSELIGCGNAELIYESSLPLGATEEISSSPPFYGFSTEDIHMSSQRKTPVVTDVLLSASSQSSDDSCPEFDIVERVGLYEPVDVIVSSLEEEEFYEEPFSTVMGLADLKAERYQERNDLTAIKKISSKEDNQKFIKNFEDWMLSQSGENSTIGLKLGHNFHYPDSFLNWITSQIEDFNLLRLIDFAHESNFISVPSPNKWLEAIGGPSGLEFPGRRDEAVKAYKKLLLFIRYNLNQTTFDGESIIKKRAIKEHIKDVQEETNDENLQKQYKDIAAEQRSKRDAMSEIVNPSNEEDKLSAPETWFASEECKNILLEAENIWKESVKRNKVTKKHFERYSKIAFLELAMSDKLRVGVYNALNNRDWATMKSVYLPAGYVDPHYDNLPKSWKIYSKPTLGNAAPSRYEIRIPGTRKGLKNKQRQVITLNLRTHEILERYQDLKRLVWPNPSFDSPFFVNYSGESLPSLRNYDGSLLKLVGRVTGISGFTLKDTRKSLDSQIQNNPQLKTHIKDLNSHSAEVGSQYYDRLDGARRSLLNHCINQKEGSDRKRASEPSEEIRSKRSKQDQTDKETLRKEAEVYLQQQKKKKYPKDLSPSALGQEDISFLCTHFKDVVGDDNWTTLFYTKVDSDKDFGQRLRMIEKRLFQKLQDDIVKGRDWDGSKRQNEAADQKISVVVKKRIESAIESAKMANQL